MTDDHFDLVLARVAALSEEDDDDGPTPAALATATRLLTVARPLVGAPFPRATAATPGGGGVHVYWKGPNRSVQLTVEPDGAAWLYHRFGETYAVERPATAPLLAEWLCRFGEGK